MNDGLDDGWRSAWYTRAPEIRLKLGHQVVDNSLSLTQDDVKRQVDHQRKSPVLKETVRRSESLQLAI